VPIVTVTDATGTIGAVTVTVAVPTIPSTTPLIVALPAPTPVMIPLVALIDATEVFEFPTETSESEACEAVAELLLSRARDRRAERLALKQAC